MSSPLFVSDCDLIYQYTGSGAPNNMQGVFNNETQACDYECNGLLPPSKNYFLGWDCASAPENSPYNLGYKSDCKNVYATLFYNETNGDQKTILDACQKCNPNTNLQDDYNYNNIGECSQNPAPLNIGYNSDGHSWFFNTSAGSKDSSTPKLACDKPTFTIADQINNIRKNYGSNWKIIGQCINEDATNTSENFENYSSSKNNFSLYLILFVVIIFSLVLIIFRKHL
uniref:Transmembrane protein n=1 Tax=viral metagenome TaxID=1070528 RepID=A0A6C0KTJ0_9ZZZZ